MKTIFLISLLLSRLGACSTNSRKGPAGCLVTGPTVSGETKNSVGQHTATYTVTGFKSQNEASLTLLQGVVGNYLWNVEEDGFYDVLFLEAGTNRILYSRQAQVMGDILDQKKIR